MNRQEADFHTRVRRVRIFPHDPDPRDCVITGTFAGARQEFSGGPVYVGVGCACGQCGMSMFHPLCVLIDLDSGLVLYQPHHYRPYLSHDDNQYLDDNPAWPMRLLELSERDGALWAR